MVEIETTSFCNRKCWFCSNNKIDRTQHNFMSDRMYLDILDSLSAISYCGKVSFSHYNEPLAEDKIFEDIRLAKSSLPDALLHLNTNGDYLTPDILEKLSNVGLGSICIQAYPVGTKKRKRFSHSPARILINTKAMQAGLPEAHIKLRHGYLDAFYQVKDLAVCIRAMNFEAIGTNRGGLVDIEQGRRTTPCIVPLKHFYIEYTGDVMPCCNLRGEAEIHKPYVLGNVKDNTIFDIYSGMKAGAFRKDLQPPCRSCLFAV